MFPAWCKDDLDSAVLMYCLLRLEDHQNSSSIPSPGSTVTGWNWNFGDPPSGANNTSTLQNPNHLYTTLGTYQVKHWVTSAAGCPSDTMIKAVTVVALPTASFTYT